jgi:hypothetical protein
MSFDEFQGVVVEVDGAEVYVNEGLDMQLQLVYMCPKKGIASRDACIKAKDLLDANLNEVNLGIMKLSSYLRVVYRPNTNFIQKTGDLPWSLGFCLVKVLLRFLEDTEQYREAAVSGVQFFYTQLQVLSGVQLNVDYYSDIRLYTIFLENVSEDLLEQFLEQLLSLPLFLFLRTEISKISERASQELFSTTRHRYLTIDMCYLIVKTMKQKVFPREEDMLAEVKMNKCSKVVVYNVPEFELSDVYLMPQVGTSESLDRKCLEELVEQNFKMYVTFNERGNYWRITQQERDLYQLLCREECEFHSIPIEDYRVATEKQLLEFWDLMEHYRLRKAREPDVKLVMHCTSGNGRSTWMLISYLLKQMVNKDGKDVVLGPIIQAFQVLHRLCTAKVYDLASSDSEGEEDTSKPMFEGPFFLDKYSGCPDALPRFRQEYSRDLAEMYTMDLLTQAIRNTATMRRIRAIIEVVNSNAVEEVFIHSASEGEDLYFLFLQWIFTIVKTILRSDSTAEPSRKKKKINAV